MLANEGIREISLAIFDEYLLDIIAMSFTMVSIGKYFAIMGVAVKLTKQFLDPSTRNEIFGYFSWLILAFFLMNYTHFITAIFGLYDGIANMIASSTIDWDTAFDDLEKSVAIATENSLFSVETFESIQDVGLKDTLYNLYKVELLSKLLIFIVLVVKVISTVVFVAVKAYAVIYLMILVVFGPINIGLSFIPSLNDMWKGWLQKLLNVLMWIPMLYLIDAFMLGLINKLFERLIYGNIDLGQVFGASVLSAMAIFMYIKAPSLSNFVVQGSQVGKLTMGSQTKDAMNKMKSAGSKLAGVSSGNIAAAAKK